MAMPIDLIFVRHGQSEQNLAAKFARMGDPSLFTKAYKARPVSQHRLTSLGRQQAKAAGKWLRQNGYKTFGRRYVSDYVRAKETAALLNLEGSDWYVDYMLREREWGEFDNLSDEERREISQQSINLKETDPFYWIPPNGESIAQMTTRLRNLFDTLHRECSDMQVLVVCHGEVMWAFRQMIERMPISKWAALDRQKSPQSRIQNCQIIHYTRRNPKTGKLASHLNWMRSICPWDESRSTNEWQQVRRRRFSDDDLLKQVAKTKPLFKNIKQPADW